MRTQQIIFVFTLTMLAQGVPAQPSRPQTSVKIYYADGKVRRVFTKKTDTLLARYIYPNRRGIDSMVTYQRERRNGMAKAVYDNGETIYTLYEMGRVVGEGAYDSSGRMLYQLPLDTGKLAQSILRFGEGRDYYRKDIVDTLFIINKSLPPANLSVSATGVSVSLLNNKTYLLHKLPGNTGLLEITIQLHIATRIKNGYVINGRTETFRVPAR